MHSQRAVVEAIVRGDAVRVRQAAEQHLLGFSAEVRSVMRAGSEIGPGRSPVG